MPTTPKRSRDHLVREVDVRQYDILVVGGGIAGVSVAERLAREARRRGKLLRIALVERSKDLGEGSSGRLEGWFHTGALYSGLADGHTFSTCVYAVERLINWYRRDPLFSCSKNCNLDLGQDPDSRTNLLLKVPLTKTAESPCPWFLPEAPVYYALRQQLEGGKTDADAVQWVQRAAQISARIRNAYWKENWEKEGLACAPDATRVLVLPKFAWVKGKDEARDKYQFKDSDPHEHNVEDLWHMLERYEGTGQERVRELYKTYSSRDAVMNTSQILRDLAHCAAENGVEFITETEIRGINVPAYGEVCVTGLVGYQPGSGAGEERPVHLLARQYVFALGSGFTDDLLRKKLGLRLRVTTSKSVMAVLRPPLVEHNFVRMDYYARNHFNHILRALDGDSEGHRYSMIANSAFDTNERGQLEKIAESIEGLLETARRYFPDTFYYDKSGKRRSILWYQCNKTEFFSDDERKRNYSYWTEPETGEAPMEDGRTTLASQISDRLHNILRHQIPDLKESERKCAELYGAIDILVGQGLRRGKAPNFLCVLPGKFTFFPLLAHQVYLEMECRGIFAEAPTRVGQIQQAPEPGVATPHPVVLLRSKGM